MNLDSISNITFFAFFFLMIVGTFLFQRTISLLEKEDRNTFLKFRFQQRRWYQITVALAVVSYFLLRYIGFEYMKTTLLIDVILIIGLFAFLHRKQDAFIAEQNYSNQFKTLASINFLVDLLRQIAFLIIIFFIIQKFTP